MSIPRGTGREKRSSDENARERLVPLPGVCSYGFGVSPQDVPEMT